MKRRRRAMLAHLAVALAATLPPGARATEPGAPVPNVAATPRELSARLVTLLAERDEDGRPVVDPDNARRMLDAMPDRVLEQLVARIEDDWIIKPEQLDTLLSSGMSQGKLELALSDNCVLCHTDPTSQERRTLFSLDPEAHRSPPHMDFAELVADEHFRHELSCSGCHGGSAAASDHTDDMRERWPSRKKRRRDKSWVPGFCARCHSDPDFMRRFNPAIPTDQLAKYETSIHGRLLLTEGDSKAAQCISCHGNHGIRRPTSRLSQVHAARLPETCGACHSDAEYMEGYLTEAGEPLPTDQVAQYRTSVHGVALLENGDLGAPSCNDCHGNHAALPPDVAYVTQVCRNCHLTEGTLFDGSTHAEVFSDRGWAECGECHGEHGIEKTSDDWLGDVPGTLCHDCHSTEARENPKCGEVAQHFRVSLRALVGNAQRVAERAEELSERGLDTEDLRAVHGEVEEAILNSRAHVHSFQADVFDRPASAGRKAVERCDELIERAEAEYDFRRRGLLVSMGIMALLALAIRLKLHQIEAS